MSESFPVYRSYGMFQFEKAGEVVGAVVVLAEDLYEAFYYPFKPGERSIGVTDSAEHALNLFWQSRKRSEVGRPQSHIKARIGKLSWPRYRFCGHTQECACRMRRFGGYFEQQCEVCRGWSQFGCEDEECV